MNFSKVVVACVVTTILSLPTTANYNKKVDLFYMGVNTLATSDRYKLLIPNTDAQLKINAIDYLPEIFFGYKHKINNFILGIVLSVGNSVSGKIKIDKIHFLNSRSGNAKLTASLRTFETFLIPTIEYQINKKFNLFLTSGIGFANYKIKYSNQHQSTTNQFIPIVDPGVKYNFTPSFSVFLDYNFLFQVKSYNLTDMGISDFSKYKISPAAGCEFQHNFTPSLFLILAYKHTFKIRTSSSIDINSPKTGSLKFNSHCLKASICFRL